MRLNRRSLAGLLLACVLGLGIGWLARKWAPPPAIRPVPVSAAGAVQDLLKLELPDLAGRPQALAQWRGRPLLINFWASWCGPCLEEMPLLDEVARQEGLSGVQVLGIARDSAANVSAYARAHPTSYPLLIATEPVVDLFAALGNPAQGLPFSLLVAANGEVLSLRLGAFQDAELRGLLATHSVANGSKMR
ncbi:TlpA disulfide reductase family protein [Uliginosibacterium flavum]|uniref:TlpA disulfide reductase family protein n=1 Tax=Uliginosibacterium flavum TaxID=1396831 RepID=A0ABV2TPT3_9RHOO